MIIAITAYLLSQAVKNEKEPSMFVACIGACSLIAAFFQDLGLQHFLNK